MTRFLLLFFVFFISGTILFGQEYLNENFESELSADWTLENAWAVGTAGSMSSAYFEYPNHTSFAGVNDDDAGSGVNTSGKMITPIIDLTTATSVSMSFDLFFLYGNYNSGGQELFKIYVSTDDGANWTEIQEVTEGSENWRGVGVNLTEYAGSSIKIAFEYIDGDNWNFGIGIDNILVSETPEYTGIFSIQEQLKMISSESEGVEYEINFNFLGSGNVTSYDVTFSINDGAEMTNSYTGDYNYGDVMTFTVGPCTGPGEFSIDVSINFNGNSDPSFSDAFTVENAVPLPNNYVLTDVEGNEYDLYAMLESNKSIVLDFFASWCGPCQASTPLLNDIWVANGSGSQNFQALAITVDPNDDAGVVSGLNWGGDYPAFEYSSANDELYNYYNGFFGEGAIPFFVYLCPNPSDPKFSEISFTSVGWDGNGLNAAIDACLSSLDVNEDFANLGYISLTPNPAIDFSTLSFELKETANITVKIYNSLGKIVNTQKCGRMSSGIHEVELATDKLISGIYTINIEVNEKTIAKKLSIVK